MIHNSVVVDKDPYFVIDPITRIISNESTSKVNIIQFDHNSERFTFSMPRIVEGHDMSECNVVQVHYANTDAITMEQTTGIYTVGDLEVDETDDTKITLSWLLSQNVTQRVGKLEFLVRFACTDAESNITYAWNTAIFDAIKVAKGMNNTEIIDITYPDVLATKEDRINKVYNIVGDETSEKYPTVLAVLNYLKTLPSTGGMTEQQVKELLVDGIDFLTVKQLISAYALHIDGDVGHIVVRDGKGNPISLRDVLETYSNKTIIADAIGEAMMHNTEYRIGTMSNTFEFVFPETKTDDYISSVDFVTSTTAPTLTYEDDIHWSGDDLTDGVFVPVSNKHYTIVFWYDGTYLNGAVRGVAI